MKKILTAIIFAGIIAIMTTGCGEDALLDANKTTTTQAASSEVSQQATADEVNEAEYKNNLDGLVKYFSAKKYIDTEEKNITKMDSSIIGAVAGNRYTTSYEGKNVAIELYEYDTAKLDDTAEKIIESVKNNGKFSVLDLAEVSAYVSDNSKFLMIYTDASINKENPDKTTSNYKHFEEVLKDFEAFHKNDK